jgi:hypothetical protein
MYHIALKMCPCGAIFDKKTGSKTKAVPKESKRLSFEQQTSDVALKPANFTYDIRHSTSGFTGLVFSFSLIRPSENGNFSFYRQCAIEFVAAKRKCFAGARFVCHMDKASWESEGTVST